MSRLEALLTQRLAPSFAAVAGSTPDSVDPAIRRSQHADFQADGALALSKRLGQKPRDIANKVLAGAEVDDLCSRVEISGPGFINITFREEVLGSLLAGLTGDNRLGIPLAEKPETVVIDYSAPNVAKEMHVGHLRSTIIGDACARVLDWLGHTVIRKNHIGDWGTPFGMLIEHLLDIGEDEAAHELSIGDLNGFYQAARAKFDASDEFKERSRSRVVLLQGGDADTQRLWRVLIGESQKYFMSVYDQLDVTLTDKDFAGESVYNDQLASVTDELERRGLARESDGALCVFPQGFAGRDGEPQPLIIRKGDGGYGYASTDLAAIRSRLLDEGATRLLYVVGTPQRQHLEMVFQTAREAGWLTEPARAEHVGFGSVLGKDGKILRSRAGESVKLVDLLEGATERAAAVVDRDNSELDAGTQAAVARAVGIGAVKYADLSTDRIKDYIFDYDRMMSFDGNTAPYLQYAHARVCSIFRRSGEVRGRTLAGVTLTEPAERALAIELLVFDGILADVTANWEFHRLAGYLYGLSSTFTRFYENCPVLRAEGEVRASRLALCDLTARTLSTGLNLLGIEAPDRM